MNQIFTKLSLSSKLAAVITTVILLTIASTAGLGYKFSYDNVKEAAGVELYGCANITLAMLKPEQIEGLKKGDKSNLSGIEETLDWTTHQKRIFDAQYIISLDGKLLAADSNMKKAGYQYGDSYFVDPKAVEMVKSMKHPAYSEVFTVKGEKRLAGYAPIFKDGTPNSEVIALNAIDFKEEIVSQRAWDMVGSTLLVMAIPLLVGGTIMTLYTRRAIKPLKELHGYASKITDGDLTVQPITAKSKDEVGQLALAFNQMVADLRGIVNQVKQASQQVAHSSEELTASADQTTAATEHIALSSQRLAGSTEEQLRNVNEVATAISQMSAGIQQIAANSEEVSLLAENASDASNEGVKSVQAVLGQMNEINLSVQETASIIKLLGSRSQEIGNIVSLITGIANQTNLLALNAAIEAARAGEMGRGFAVVADEVRKLAEQSADSAKQITELITEIQKETEVAVISMEKNTEKVIAGVSKTEQVSKSFQVIEHAVSSVTGKVEEVSAAVQQMAAGSQQIVRAIDVVNQVAVEGADASQQNSSASQEQLAMMEEIAASAKTLSSLAEDMQSALRKFQL